MVRFNLENEITVPCKVIREGASYFHHNSVVRNRNKRYLYNGEEETEQAQRQYQYQQARIIDQSQRLITYYPS
jgi:hypothetical protein